VISTGGPGVRPAPFRIASLERNRIMMTVALTSLIVFPALYLFREASRAVAGKLGIGLGPLLLLILLLAAAVHGQEVPPVPAGGVPMEPTPGAASPRPSPERARLPYDPDKLVQRLPNDPRGPRANPPARRHAAKPATPATKPADAGQAATVPKLSKRQQRLRRYARYNEMATAAPAPRGGFYQGGLELSPMGEKFFSTEPRFNWQKRAMGQPTGPGMPRGWWSSAIIGGWGGMGGVYGGPVVTPELMGQGKVVNPNDAFAGDMPPPGDPPAPPRRRRR
jgi:hypothetical protein